MAVMDQLHREIGSLMDGILARKADAESASDGSGGGSADDTAAAATAAAAAAASSVPPRAPVKAIDSIALWGQAYGYGGGGS